MNSAKYNRNKKPLQLSTEQLRVLSHIIYLVQELFNSANAHSFADIFSTHSQTFDYHIQKIKKGGK